MQSYLLAISEAQTHLLPVFSAAGAGQTQPLRWTVLGVSCADEGDKYTLFFEGLTPTLVLFCLLSNLMFKKKNFEMDRQIFFASLDE